jgi:hypothetical protein
MLVWRKLVHSDIIQDVVLSPSFIFHTRNVIISIEFVEYHEYCIREFALCNIFFEILETFFWFLKQAKTSIMMRIYFFMQ